MSNRKKSSKKHASHGRWGTFFPAALPLGALAGAALIILAVFIAYRPSLCGEFIWDDGTLLTKNKLIKASDGLYRLWCTTEVTDYWPVTNTTFWIEWRLWGMNPTGYRVTNLVLHIVSCLLIWLILHKLSIPGAFWAALLFAVHPVNVESVAWIAQRKNLMAMLFFLLSILCYLQAEMPSSPLQNRLYRSGAGYFYWLSLGAFVLAMLSKGSVAVLPLLLLEIVWWLRPLTRWDLMRIVPFVVFAVVLTGVNIWFQTHGQDVVIRTASFWERVLGAGGVVWFYLYKALLPINLVFVYPQWHIQAGNLLWWLPLMAAVIVTAVLWWYRQSWSRLFLFTWGFFCVSLLPVMGLTDVYFMKYALVADHYQHLAFIGVITLVAAGWRVWQEQVQEPARRAVKAVAVIAALILTLLTYQQSGLYRNEITLYQAMLEKNPDCCMAENNLGNALLLADRPQEAIEHYKQALLIKPDYAEAHNNLGNILGDTGQSQEAIEHYKQALRVKPNYPEAHVNLGIALAKAGRRQEAIDHFEQAIQLKPDYPDAYNELGIALAKEGRLQEAIEKFKQVLRLEPDFAAEVYANLALIYAKTQQSAEAIASAQKALAIARSTDQKALAERIEIWLNSYRASLSN